MSGWVGIDAVPRDRCGRNGTGGKRVIVPAGMRSIDIVCGMGEDYCGVHGSTVL